MTDKQQIGEDKPKPPEIPRMPLKLRIKRNRAARKHRGNFWERDW